MTHELKDSLVLLLTLIGTLAAVIVPLMMRRDAKKASEETRQAFAVDWGQLTERVKGQGEDIRQLQDGQRDHETRISRIEGSRPNGAAVGRA